MVCWDAALDWFKRGEFRVEDLQGGQFLLQAAALGAGGLCAGGCVARLGVSHGLLRLLPRSRQQPPQLAHLPELPRQRHRLLLQRLLLCTTTSVSSRPPPML